MPSTSPFSDFLDTATHLLDEASAVAVSMVDERTATRKFDGTLVTQTDQTIDDLLGRRLTASYPDHAILSEERNTHYDPTVRYTWVIDPIDGTTNLARGIPIWGISVGLLEWGDPVVGIAFFPLLREKYAAIKAMGATLNGAAISTAAERETDDQHFIMCCTRTGRRYRVETPLKSRIMGSAAYHLLKVADGSALAAIEATPKVWDLAAALLILSEAGGTIHPISNMSLPFPLAQVAADYKSRSFPLIAAANSDILASVVAGISEYHSR